MQLAFTYLEIGDLRNAKTICNEILRKQPDDADAHYLAGLICYRQNNYTAAEKHLMKALRLNPLNAFVNRELGNVFKERGEVDEAVSYYQKAVELNPKLVETHNTLGDIFRVKGNISEAITCYQKALYGNPGYFQAADNLKAALLEEARVDLIEEKGPFENILRSRRNAPDIKILIAVPVFNRKKITQLSLAQTKRYKTSACHLQVYNDHSTQYDNSFLAPYADEVIQLPVKKGIHHLRWHQFRKFLEMDFDCIYMTDNDVLHDPRYITVLETLYEMGDRKLPVSLYNTKSLSFEENTLYSRNGVSIRRIAAGVSMFYDRRMVEKIVSMVDNHHAPDHWDFTAIEYLGLPWITPQESYLEHYGKGGIHNVDFETDRAMNPTTYLQERWDPVLKYLSGHAQLQITF